MTLKWFIESITKVVDRHKKHSGKTSLKDCSLMNLILTNEVIKE